MVGKKVEIVLSPSAEEVYEKLNKLAINSKVDRTILNSINYKKELIKQNPFYGNPVAKKLIPKEFITKYGITNLFRVELPHFWRMIYSLEEGESQVEIIAFVLDIIDHKKYNKKYKYK